MEVEVYLGVALPLSQVTLLCGVIYRVVNTRCVFQATSKSLPSNLP